MYKSIHNIRREDSKLRNQSCKKRKSFFKRKKKYFFLIDSLKCKIARTKLYVWNINTRAIIASKQHRDSNVCVYENKIPARNAEEAVNKAAGLNEIKE